MQTNIRPMRFQWIDMAKGLGILLMILGHMHVGQSIRDFIYSFHMIMFVMISGYLYKEDTALKNYLPRKVRTLLIPYLMTNVVSYFVRLFMLWRAGFFTVSGALGILRAQALTTVGGSSFYAKHFITIETCGPIWFVTFLFCIVVFYAVLNRVKLKNKIVQDIVYLVLLLLAAWGGKTYAFHNGFLPWNLDVVPVGMVFYHIGVMVKRYHVMEKIRRYFIWIVLLVLWLSLYPKTGSIIFATREYLGFPYSIVVSVCGSLVVMLAMKEFERIRFAKPVKDGLAWIGRNSMIVLAVHTIEFVHVEWIEHLQERVGNVWFSFLIYAIVVLLCTFVYTQGKKFVVSYICRLRQRKTYKKTLN